MLLLFIRGMPVSETTCETKGLKHYVSIYLSIYLSTHTHTHRADIFYVSRLSEIMRS